MNKKELNLFIIIGVLSLLLGLLFGAMSGIKTVKNTNEKLKGTISDLYSLNSQSSIHPTISNHLNSGRSHKNLENSLPTGSLMRIKHLSK